MIRTIGIDNRKYNIAETEVSVTPGISTVNSANSVGSTKSSRGYSAETRMQIPSLEILLQR